MFFSDIGFDSYEDYRNGVWWKRLVYTLITGNKKARCFICDRNYSLLVHHIDYSNLGREKLNRDVFVVCWNCHRRCHFFLFIFKIPLRRKNLIRRVYFLKFKSCIWRRKPFLALWYLLKSVLLV